MWARGSGRSIALVDLPTAQRRLGADVLGLPHSVVLIGWDATADQWLAYEHDQTRELGRLEPLTRHVQRALGPRPAARSFWFLCCLWDGWRERVAPSEQHFWVDPPDDIATMSEWTGPAGSIPRLSNSQQWVGCFSAQLNDPSAVLLPEGHWLRESGYRVLFARVAGERRPWVARKSRGIYAGGDHGNPEPALGGLTARQLLRKVGTEQRLPLDVFLDQPVTRRRQLTYKFLLDVDGYARTWDAWAWKMASGSVVLSQASHWETTFTREFEPWEHFVPVAADFSDLDERLTWCLENDEGCREMAARARRTALEIYAVSHVEQSTRRLLTQRLALSSG
jgi:hypothetical protein